MRISPAFLALPFAIPISLGLGGFSETANAEEKLPGKVIWGDQSELDLSPIGSHTSKTIFLNRCPGGCVVSPGPNNSRNDTSRIVNSTSFIPEFTHDDETWNELVQCMKEVYEPFDIIITDVDPGQTEHFEAIVAGEDDDIGFSGVDGLAPGGCGIQNNAITFTFANQMSTVDRMCWTAAQETAHAFGLDHELECADPMTYLTNCSPAKTFQNVSASCGEDTPRQCNCTNSSTQNSYGLLRAHFGPGPLTPPDIAVARPANGTDVAPNFPIEVLTEDNIRVTSVEFSVNGQVVDTLTSPPYIINAPDGLTGAVNFQVRSLDNLGTSSVTISHDVTIVTPEPLAEFGASCQGSEQCETGLCAISDGKGVCTMTCDLAAEADSCPGDSTCVDAGGTGVCFVAASSSGGCQSGGSSTVLSGLFLLGLFGIFRKRYAA